MSRATRDSAAVRALLARVDSRSTGKLTVGAGAVEVAVYLLRGEVVAATAADDDRQCVRMLQSNCVVTSSQADEYDVMIESGDDVFSALLVFGPAFDDVLSGRFRQNLCDYLSSVSAPRFYEQKGVFVANIQMGHDTRRLLDELCAQCDVARLVDVDNLVVRGSTEPIDPVARRVAGLVGAEPRTISSLLHDLPLEPTRARVLVGQLVAGGVLDPPPEPQAAAATTLTDEGFDPGEFIGELEPLEDSEELTVALPPPPRRADEVPTLIAAPPPPAPIHLLEHAVQPAPDRWTPAPVGRPDASFDDDDPRASSEVGRDLGPVTDELASHTHGDETPARPPIHRLAARRPLADDDEEEDEDDARTEQVDRRTLSALLYSGTPLPTSASGSTPFPSRGSPLPPPSRLVSPPPPPPRGSTPPRPVREPTARPMPTAQPVKPSTWPPAPTRTPAGVPSPPENVASRTPPPAPTAAGAPRSLADWLNRTDTVDEDELDFFEDHDHESRGGEADGQFRTDRKNLEKVEIGGNDSDTSELPWENSVEELEALEAPAVKYGAPVLSAVDAAAKIEVANEVLTLVAQAFDEAEGPGRGRAVMQLLVDGVPSPFSALLHDLKVADDGELPDEQLLRNLNSRPATEHRQLLNNSLVDIIERALSSAADELPEEAFDEVFGAVAGYRQRLGL